MTRQTVAALESANLNTSNRSAREIARMVRDDYMTVDLPYQRGSVWTEDQRIALVRSWLTGVPIPAIIVNDRSTAWWTDIDAYDPRSLGPSYAVVDGRQRVECAIAWFESQLAVPASWFDPGQVEWTQDGNDGPYVTYDGLTIVGQRLMANRAMLPMAQGTLPTVRAEAEIYLLVNGGGTPQSDADMDNARRIAES